MGRSPWGTVTSSQWVSVPSATQQPIEAVARFTETHRERLLELDVNPLLALPDRAVAVDALIKTR